MHRSTRRSLLPVMVTGALVMAIASGPAARADAPVSNRASLKQDVCYQVVTDRFADGDTSNDNPSKSPGLYD